MKKRISLFLRKPLYGKSFSIENYYSELFKNNKNNNFIFQFKVCPLESRGVLNRIVLAIWASFNQGDVNHVCGDVNFISIFLNKKKTINTILDSYSLARLKGFKRFLYYIFWIKIPVLKSSIIVTISNKTKKEIAKYSNINKKNFSVINVCAQNIFKKKIRNKINKTPKILIVGINVNKNINNILLSLNKINCELIVIGQLQQEHLKIIKELQIKYKNYVSINNKFIFKKYCESDILVYASNYEGFGIPILEAQTVGRSVVTSKLEPMTFVGGKGALYVDPKSVKSINDGIRQVINKPKLRNSLIKNGFKNIKRFNKLKILEQHFNCYNKILKN